MNFKTGNRSLRVETLRVFFILALVASFCAADILTMHLLDVKTVSSSQGTFVYTLTDANAQQITFSVSKQDPTGNHDLCAARTPSCTYTFSQTSLANTEFERATGVHVVFQSTVTGPKPDAFNVDFSVTGSSPLPGTGPSLFARMASRSVPFFRVANRIHACQSAWGAKSNTVASCHNLRPPRPLPRRFRVCALTA